MGSGTSSRTELYTKLYAATFRGIGSNLSTGSKLERGDEVHIQVRGRNKSLVLVVDDCPGSVVRSYLSRAIL